MLMAAVVLAAAPGALAQSGGDPSGYCTGDGGPEGRATDAEHNVLLGDPPLPAGVRTSRVTVGGVATRVQESGPAWAEDAVVFMHGSPDNSRDWDDLVAASGRFSRAIAFDVPGYGKSDKVTPPEVQTMGGAVRYLQGVLDQLGVKRAVLVGHDFGGIWGMEWAASHTGSLRGAVLIDGGVLIDYVPHPDAVAFATPGVGEQEMAATTRQNFVGRIKQANPRLPDEFLHRLYDDYDRATRCGILRYYRSSSENFQTRGRDQAAALRPLDLPALVLWGGKDPYVPPEQAQKQKEAFPSARVVTFPEAGHWPHIEERDRTRSEVVSFLEPRVAVRQVLARARPPRRTRAPARGRRLAGLPRGGPPRPRAQAPGREPPPALRRPGRVGADPAAPRAAPAPVQADAQRARAAADDRGVPRALSVAARTASSAARRSSPCPGRRPRTWSRGHTSCPASRGRSAAWP